MLRMRDPLIKGLSFFGRAGSFFAAAASRRVEKVELRREQSLRVEKGRILSGTAGQGRKRSNRVVNSRLGSKKVESRREQSLRVEEGRIASRTVA